MPPPNPLDSLVLALTAPQPTNTDPSDPLDTAGDLVPERAPTEVRDLLNGQELSEFRRKFLEGSIEANVVTQALSILRSLLVAKGILPA